MRARELFDLSRPQWYDALDALIEDFRMPYQIQFAYPAEAAMNSLSPDERARLEAAIERLREGRFEEDSHFYRIRVRDGQTDVNVLRADHDLRVLFTVSDDKVVTVLDIISRKFAVRYG
jgi:mRNA-degrading endonuclease RelE of RelBE toxin-antitoxin system